MKSFLLAIGSSFLAGTLTLDVFAQTPRDLQMLADGWHLMEKTEAANDWIQLEFGARQGATSFDHFLMQEVETLREAGSQLSALEYKTFAGNVRDHVFAALLPTGKPPKFCQAIPSTPVKVPDDEEWTPEELEKKQREADYAKCRRSVRSLFGGIVYADPDANILQTTTEEGASSTIVWISSMIQQDNYLRVKFLM